MKILNVLLIISFISFVSCSSKGKKGADGKENDEVAMTEEDSDFIVDAEDDELIAEGPELVEDEGMLAMEAEGSEMNETANVDDMGGSESMASVGGPEIAAGGGTGSYTVQSGDTLMLIAFKLFGDYRRWRELQSSNGIGSNISVGTVLTYQRPATPFVWNPRGLPYLIKHGDSLGTISEDKYGTSAKWRSIYENNRPLIRDPNLIFAGFTIHYIPARDLASE